MQLSLDMPSLKSANNALRHHPLEVQLRESFFRKSCREKVRKVRRRRRGRNAFVRAIAEIFARTREPFRLDEETRRSERQRADKLCWRISCPKISLSRRCPKRRGTRIRPMRAHLQHVINRTAYTRYAQFSRTLAKTKKEVERSSMCETKSSNKVASTSKKRGRRTMGTS